MNNSGFAMFPLEMYGNRLDIQNIFSVAGLFYQHISVPEWEKWGCLNEAFAPFESLFHVDTAYSWKKEHAPNGPKEAPEGYKWDVRWMPTYSLTVKENQTFAFMEWAAHYYSTTWHPTIVGVDYTNHNLLIWDVKEKVWAEFRFAEDPVNDAFLHFLRAWIDW